MNTVTSFDRPLSPDVGPRLPVALATAAAWPERPESVQVIETHISWIFLTERFAYKLKKPLRFDFLDFSTLELRRRACFDELFLNRRLGNSVYLSVVPVTRSNTGEVSVQGAGTVVDWLVKMARLPQERALSVLIRTGDATTTHSLVPLADKLTEFYLAQPSVTIDRETYRQRIERHIVANQTELANHAFDSLQIARLYQAQLRYLKTAGDVLDRRVGEGRIIDGHGDLRPEHIFLLPDPVIIDCIEFNNEYRVLDVADELGFLSMECDLLGASDAAEVIVERYRERSGDLIPTRLLDFYRLYRACVRAKVAALRSSQLNGVENEASLVEATRYLDLADQYAKSFGSPAVIMMQGTPGTGKSTVARYLARELGMEHIQSDAVRRELFGSGGGVQAFGCARYSLANRFRVYEEMHSRAGELLRHGVSLILDATYLAAQHRNAAFLTAEQYGSVLIAVHCHCPRSVALERISKRIRGGGSLSEARPEWFEYWKSDDAGRDDSVPYRCVMIDSTGDKTVESAGVFNAIRECCLSA